MLKSVKLYVKTLFTHVLKIYFFVQIKYDVEGVMFVEQIVDEADKNHGEDDTDANNDGRMYKKKRYKMR